MNIFTEQELIDFFKSAISEELRISKDEITVDVEFINFGIDSIRAIFILQHLEKFVGADLNPLLLWDYPTIQSLSTYIMTLRHKG